MSTVTINAKATYYHLTPENEDIATAWQDGGPRKGKEDGQVAIGFIEFDPDEIITACSGKWLPSADLVLTRDTNYGTDAVDMSLTYVPDEYELGVKTWAQCRSGSVEASHAQVTATGNTCTIHLPGYHLNKLKSDEATRGFLIYQEPGEGTDKLARFTTTAKLKLNLYTATELLNNAAAWTSPYWMRPIGQGDVICKPGRSHVRELREILYYINVRRKLHNLSTVTHTEIILQYLDANSRCPFEKWPTIIRSMQDLVDDIYTEEQKTAVDWIRTGDITQTHSDSNIILPNAEIINQLRNALETKVSGAKEVLNVTKYARTYFDHYDTDFTVNKNEATTWSKKAPRSGMNWEYTTETGEKRKVYHRRYGFWLLKPLMAGKSISSAKLRLTKVDGNNNKNYQITLYPVKVSSIPNSRVSVNTVFKNTTEVMGKANASVGQTVDIPLTASAINKLCNDSSYCGVGVDDHDYWANFGNSATLIINDT